jgi:S1-C subfamily serine protease
MEPFSMGAVEMDRATELSTGCTDGKEDSMSRFRFGIVCFAWVLVIPLCSCPIGRADEFPSNQVLEAQNVALQIQGLVFASGLNKDENGNPNGKGLEVKEAGWGGSGFIVGEDGTIVTNYHVAKSAIIGKALFQDKSSYEVHNVKVYDPEHDLAILKLSAEKTFAPCTLGDSDKVQPRDKVLAVGNPKSQGINITEGTISQVIRDDNGQTTMMRHTAPTTHGNSGGPLYRGNDVIGVNTYIMAGPEGQTGFGMSVPINLVKTLLQDPNAATLKRLEKVFNPQFDNFSKKAYQINAVTGKIPAAQKQGNDLNPGGWKTTIQSENLTDYVLMVETPFRNVVMVVVDRFGKTAGVAKERAGDKNQLLPLAISSDSPNQYTVVLMNRDYLPVNFALKIYKILW